MSEEILNAESQQSAEVVSAPVQRTKRQTAAERQAKNNPAMSAAREKLVNPTHELPSRDFSLDKPLPNNSQVIESVGTLEGDYMSQLAFYEEPVDVLVHPGAEKNPAPFVSCSCQGVPAEILVNGKWEKIGWFPVNQRVTTKRKYAEILLRSKPIDVRTEHEDANVERPRNVMVRTARMQNAVSVVNDRNPKGAQWLSQLMAEAA